MTSQDIRIRLAAIGDAMLNSSRPVRAEQITRQPMKSVRHPRGRRNRLFRGTAAALVCFGAGAGTVAAVNTLSTDELNRALPGSAVLFTGTQPSCRELEDQLFLCTLTKGPELDIAMQEPDGDSTLLNFAGRLELLVDSEQAVAGGCRAITADGITWVCAQDERAIALGFITADQLGQRSDGPSVG